ncbi:hypothetical protein EXS74_03630 [Candidatus Woesearchaeota archaeon]|nr:hypothetical protein [Candidatus Woesearchaeota archaeon]
MDIPQLTTGETKVYRALLKINESSVGNILKFSGVSHSKIYDILKRLAEKGLVSTITKNGKQYFSAADPKTLQNLIKEQEEKLNQEKEELKLLMPQLLAEKNAKKTQPIISAFEGINGIKHLLEESLEEVKKGEEILILGTPQKIVEYAGGYLKDWQKRRIEKGAICKIICDPGSPPWKEEWWRDSKNKKQSLIKASASVSPAYLVITNKSITTIYFANDILGFKVSHEEIAKKYKAFFEEIWKQK